MYLMTTEPNSPPDFNAPTDPPPQTTQEDTREKEEAIEEAELDKEFAEAKTPRDLFKRIKRQLKGITEFVTKMREMDRYNRKWLEKRLEKVEDEIFNARVEIKTLKNLYKKEGKN
jgi:hypothetical protein